MNVEQDNSKPLNQKSPERRSLSTSTIGVFISLFFPVAQTIVITYEIIQLIFKSNTLEKEMTMHNLIIIGILTLYVWLLALSTCYVNRLAILKFAKNTVIGIAIIMILYCLLGTIIELKYETFFYDVQFIPLTFMFLFYYLMIGIRIRNIIGYKNEK